MVPALLLLLATPALAQAVLLDEKGSGTRTTSRFTAPQDWDLAWSYDCASFGQVGNFQVYVYKGDGTLSNDTLVNQLGRSGQGVEHYHTGGERYLVVNAVCDWTVKATAAGQVATTTTTRPVSTTSATTPTTRATVPAPVAPPSATTTVPPLPRTGPSNRYNGPIGVAGTALLLLGWWLVEKGSWTRPVSTLRP